MSLILFSYFFSSIIILVVAAACFFTVLTTHIFFNLNGAWRKSSIQTYVRAGNVFIYSSSSLTDNSGNFWDP